MVMPDYIITGEETAVSVIPRSEGERVGHGVTHPLHQGHRRSCRTGRSAGWTQEWTGKPLIEL